MTQNQSLRKATEAKTASERASYWSQVEYVDQLISNAILNVYMSTWTFTKLKKEVWYMLQHNGYTVKRYGFITIISWKEPKKGEYNEDNQAKLCDLQSTNSGESTDKN